MMTDIAELKEIFTDKLHRTGSLDAAFTKAVWIAYTRGRDNAVQELTQAPTPKYLIGESTMDWSEHYTNIYPLAKNMYYLMSKNDWKEAEPLAKELKDIVTELHRIIITNNVQSGTGFTDPYTYEGT